MHSMENRDDIRGLLQDQFRDFEAEPPAHLWAEIESELAPQPRRRALWLPYLAVAASAVILLGFWQLLRPAPEVPGDHNAIVQEQGPLAQPPASSSLDPATLPASVESKETGPNKELDTVPPQAPSRRNLQQPLRPGYTTQPQPLYSATTADRETTVAPREATPQQIASVPTEELQPIESALRPQQNAVIPVAQVLTPGTIQPLTQGTMQKVKHNKLDLDDFSLENVVAFASNEISKWANSPLDFEHEKSEEAERKTFGFELGDLKITRTSYRKTINQ